VLGPWPRCAAPEPDERARDRSDVAALSMSRSCTHWSTWMRSTATVSGAETHD